MSFCTGHLKKRIFYTVDLVYSFFRGGGGWVICDFTDRIFHLPGTSSTLTNFSECGCVCPCRRRY